MAKMGLTPRQKHCYDFLRMYMKEKGLAPTFEEIKVGLKLGSKSGVSRLMKALEERGYIRTLPHAKRSVSIVGDNDNHKELFELRTIKLSAKEFLRYKSDWEKFRAENPNHRDNHLVYAPKVQEAFNQFSKLVKKG